MTRPVDRDELVRGKEDVKLDCGCTDPGGFVSLADSTLLEAQFVLPETQSKEIKVYRKFREYIRVLDLGTESGFICVPKYHFGSIFVAELWPGFQAEWPRITG